MPQRTNSLIVCVRRSPNSRRFCAMPTWPAWQSWRRLLHAELGAVLARLVRLPGALIAGMSGSGATCSALFSDRGAAKEARMALAAAEPDWWCAADGLIARKGLCR
jgi:4-diphosphocytidyl-2C-methyl-D-erythritol kinase